MRRRGSYPATFLLPGFAVYLLFFIVPTVASFYYSLTDWNLNTTSAKFIGIANFTQLFSDAELVAAIWHTLVYAIGVTLIRNLIGLVLALMLNAKIKGENVFRTVFFMPYVIAPIVIGYLFTAVYDPTNGPLNQLLRAVGLGVLTHAWLSNPNLALSATIMTEVWRTSGFAMVIFLAGLQVIPSELFESADLDGAGFFGKFFYVMFPLLAPAVTINLVLSIIGTMKVFVMILVLTDGGPGFATQVMNTYILHFFSIGLYGYGTAANLVLSALITAIGLPVLFALRRREVEL